jgi:hypothetical protein
MKGSILSKPVGGKRSQQMLDAAKAITFGQQLTHILLPSVLAGVMPSTARNGKARLSVPAANAGVRRQQITIKFRHNSLAADT